MVKVDPEAKIACPTPQYLQTEFDTLAAILALGEKEDTWEKLERALIRFAAVTRGGGYKHVPQYVEGIGRKGVGLSVVACMLSDRGRLSGVATEVLQTFAPRLGASFQPLVSLYLDSLVQLFGRPNKVFLKRTERCMTTIISNCQLPSILPELRKGLNDEAATCRRGCASGLERISREWTKDLIGDKGIVVLEDALKKMATDKDPEVRQISKRVWARFNEVWPERVADFSAPLTPTIRRYLDIHNPTAGPNKTKPALRPAAPPATLRPVSASSSSSSNPPVVQSDKPQHHREQALNSRPVRPPSAPVSARIADPSQGRSPTRKDVEMVTTAADSPVKAEASRPHLSKSVSTGSGEAFAPIGALGRHGRSVSHNILPVSKASAEPGPSFTNELAQLNPLTRPSRPHLQSSSSLMSLPSHSSELGQAQPPRRFAPPTRIVRPGPLSSTEEDGAEDSPIDYFSHTPSGGTVLCNPQRLVPGGLSDRWAAVGLGKRPVALGQAQRRVVTTPGGGIEGFVIPLRTPGLGNRTLSRGPRGKQPEDEQASIEPTNISQQPMPSSTAYQAPIPPAALPIDSPLMPIMIRSTFTTAASSESSKTAVEDPAEELLKVEPEAADFTVLPDRLVYPADIVEMIVTEQENSTMAEDLDLAASIPLPMDADENDLGPDKASIDLVDDAVTKPWDTCDLPDAAHASLPTAAPLLDEVSTKLVLDSAAVVITSKVGTHGIPHAERPGVATARPGSRPPTLPKVELPSVRTQKTPVIEKPRTISGQVDRKPFKPTARPAGGPTIKSSVSSKPSGRATVATSSASTNPSSSATLESKIVSTAAPVAASNKVEPTNSTLASKPNTKPSVPSVGGISKPTASTAAKVSAKPEQARPTVKTKAQSNKLVHAQITLPPVRKEKVKLKAALPSFVPLRGKGKATTAILASSTASNGERKVVVAKVRPESIPLPLSPAEKARLRPAQIPLPRSPVLYSSPSAQPVQSSPLATMCGPSPLTIASPHLVSLADQASPSSRGPFADLPLPKLNDLNLPIDNFNSASTRYASTAPPMSSDSDGEEDENEDPVRGITFKPAPHSGQTRIIRPKALSTQMAGENDIDLIEFSASSRPAQAPRSDVSIKGQSAEALLAKIVSGSMGTPGKSTPGSGRKVLSVRDTNLVGVSGDGGIY